MKTKYISAVVLGVLYLCFFGYLAVSASHLPAKVPIHFGISGQPNGWSSRFSFIVQMVVFGLVFPLLVPTMLFWTRFLPDQLYHVPNHDYWFAPVRRAETLAYIFRHSLWFACMALCFVVGIYYSVIHLKGASFDVMVFRCAGLFFSGTVIWGVGLVYHFYHVASGKKPSEKGAVLNGP